ncbi:MAG: cytochrome C biogenesis protein CcdA [Candidatus Dojkabacteria bacterium]|nr:MAG: cytochrome C biogenesis protein CcdA [Candidatus Dojkabacteria bacterium]
MLLQIFASFFAGILTVLSPCIFPFLPVILTNGEKKLKKPLIIVASLSISVIISTLIFKTLVELLDLPKDFLRDLSAILLFVIGFFIIFPEVWNFIENKLEINSKSNQLLLISSKKRGALGDIAIGASLGPAFASCSPIYTIILAQVLPANFFEGTIYLVFYAIGLGLILLVISFLGDVFVRTLRFAVNPHGNFKKIVGFTLIIVGFLIFFDYDKTISSFLLQNETYLNFLEKVIDLESQFTNSFN